MCESSDSFKFSLFCFSLIIFNYINVITITCIASIDSPYNYVKALKIKTSKKNTHNGIYFNKLLNGTLQTD